MINILTFESINLKLDKNTRKDIDIYYVAYVNKNKPNDWKVRSVNPLYLMINNVFCSAGEENNVKYLNIEKNHCDPAINKCNLVFDSIRDDIKKIICEEVKFNDDFNKIKFNLIL